MQKWIITDWAGNRLHKDKTFKGYEDGWCFIYENYSDKDSQYDDLFVIREK